MTDKTLFLILLLSLTSLSYPENIFYRFETGGAFSLSTFNKSINAVLTENLGYNLTPSVNINISGEQQYRNRSFNSSIYLGAEYRFPVYRDFQIPLGSIMGFKHLHIGSFSDAVAIWGITSGLYYQVWQRVQLRAIYRGKLYFDDVNIWGNDLLLGFSFLF
ncbi:MAG: hypothetical protein GX267_19265 [Fibrobacter sp.]|jgi:hypothetical protein|nr:hypothetical protein [Fibrobacter sp.]